MITERMMQRLLYQAFIAEEIESTTIDLTDWRWPWREIVLAAESRAMGFNAYSRLGEACRMIAGDDEQAPQQWMHDISEAREAPHFPTLAEIADTLEPVGWLWENWVPRGMLTLLGAFQGTGKSYFVMDLARVAMHGPQWPDGAALTHDPATAKVVYVDAEGIPQVNHERACDLGLDTRRMYLMMAGNGEMMDFLQPAWRDRLLDLAWTVRPELILIDSLSAITTKGTNSAEEVSGLLTWLNGLAREVNAGVVLLHHLRKPGGGQLSLPGVSIHDFRGSTHIVALARSVIGLSVVQEPGKQFSLNGPRHMEVVKTNLAPVYPPKLEIRIDRGGPGVRFEYGAVATTVPDAEPSAEEWLIDFLTCNGPTAFQELIDAAIADGFSKATIYRARKKLGSRIVDSGKQKAKGNLWQLAEDAQDDSDDVDD